MASLYKKGGYIYISFYENNKRVQKSLGLKVNRENWRIAKDIKLEKERELATPKTSVKSYLDLDDAIKRFYRYKSDSKARTKEIYEVVFKHFKTFVSEDKRVIDITEDDLQNFKNYLQDHISNVTKEKLSQNSISSYFRTLSAFFNFLIKSVSSIFSSKINIFH